MFQSIDELVDEHDRRHACELDNMYDGEAAEPSIEYVFHW